jgi:hypothetical protein
MKHFLFILPVILLFSLHSCDDDTTIDNPDNNEEPQLLFKSGFEGDVRVYPPQGDEIDCCSDYLFIKGKDSESGFSWPLEIWGSAESGLHLVDTMYNHIKAEIQLVEGIDGVQTHALYTAIEGNTDECCTQCPYEILDIEDGRQDLHIKYWIKIDSASVYTPNSWRTFFEWKTKDYAEGTGFRLISYIYADEDGKPYWHWQGDANPENPIWEIDNKDIPVPVNKWFMTEFYWHWSEGDDGRALWKINDEVVGDHMGPTTRNSKPIDFIMITQIYGNINPKYQWIDNIEIWTGLPVNRIE